MKVIILVVVIFLFSYTVHGQIIGHVNTDTAYINSQTSKWSVRAYAISKYNEFTIAEQNVKALFYPDVKLGAGLGFAYHNLALDVAFNISSSDPSHKSGNLSLISAVYFNQNLLDVEFQLYNHYTISERDESNNELISQFRTDITVFNAGLNYNYNFNYHKFSFNAPFIGTEIQKHSAGSPLAGVYINYFDLHADSSIFPNIPTSESNPQNTLTDARLFSAGITAGYAFTWVLPRHFYVTLSLTPKIGISAGEVKEISYEDVHYGIAPGILTRNAVGYAGKKFYGFLSILGDYNILRLGDDDDLYYDPLKVKLLVGFRFN